MTVVVVSFIVCLLFFLGVGIASASRRKNTSEDYLLASRSVGPWVVALSAVATNNSGFMFVGLIGATYTEGLSSLALMGGWVMGDYVAGPSHVMPTGGTARFASGLGVHHFLRHVPVVRLGANAVRELGPAAAAIGRAEGLTAHARAVEMRLEGAGAEPTAGGGSREAR
ncbi:MAG: histidinol dehydrogenase [Candidatus Krumholzibacteriota bacterium]|nr:histidinol dehydrogenase [Candidatus Krumholzibacteriota bacterium]